jgi:hypothetical protein
MRLFQIILLLFLCTLLPAQHVDKIPENNNEDNEDYFLLFFDFTNNSDFTGKLNKNLGHPAFSGTAAYFSPYGFDITASGITTGNSDEYLSSYTGELDLSAGYNLALSKSFSLYPSYTRFLYGKKASSLQKTFSNEVHVDLQYDYKFLTIDLTPGFYWGNYRTFYTTLRNYYTFNLSNVFFRNNLLSFQQGYDLNFGNYEYLNRFYYNELLKDRSLLFVLLQSDEILSYVIKTRRAHPELTFYRIITDYLDTKAEDNFKLTSFVIYESVSWYVGDACVNLGIYGYKPLKTPDYLQNDFQFYFNLGISLSI